MGLCHGKPIENPIPREEDQEISTQPNSGTPKPPKSLFYSPSPHHNSYKESPGQFSVPATPLRKIFKGPFPPPSPAKHIKAFLARRHGSVKPNAASIPEGSEADGIGLDKSFGFSRQFLSKYELGEEVGRGHFGYTSSAKVLKGDLKGHEVAVKVIAKSKVRSSALFFFFSF